MNIKRGPMATTDIHGELTVALEDLGNLRAAGSALRKLEAIYARIAAVRDSLEARNPVLTNLT